MLALGWIVVTSLLIVSTPPAGAASPTELVEQATTALNTGDADALATLLAAPLDQDFAVAYLERLDRAGARDMIVTVGSADHVTISGRSAAGPFEVGLVARARDGRWFLIPLPPL